MNGYSGTTRTCQDGRGVPAFPAVLVAVTWIFDLIIDGVWPEAWALNTMMTGPSTIGAVCLFTLATALVLTSFSVNVRPHSESPTMRCMA